MWFDVKTKADRDKLTKDYLDRRQRVRQQFLDEKLGDDTLQYEASKLFKPIIESTKSTADVTTEKLDKVVAALENLPMAIEQENPLTTLFTERALPAPPKPKKQDVIVDPDQSLDLELLKKHGFESPSKVDPTKYKETIDGINYYNRYTLGPLKKPSKNDADKRLRVEREIKALGDYRDRLKLLSNSRQLIVEGKGIGGAVMFYNHPDQLADRLQLLAASKQAGNTGLENEMSLIIDECARKGYITKKMAIQLDRQLLH